MPSITNRNVAKPLSAKIRVCIFPTNEDIRGNLLMSGSRNAQNNKVIIQRLNLACSADVFEKP